MEKPKKDPIYKSFGYAFEGIFAVIKKERNMKIHCCMMILVIAAGIFFQISVINGACVLVCLGSSWRWKW